MFVTRESKTVEDVQTRTFIIATHYVQYLASNLSNGRFLSA